MRARVKTLLALLSLGLAQGCIGGRYELRREEIAFIAGDGPMPLVETSPAQAGEGSLLRYRARPVSAGDPQLHSLIARMRETLDASGGVGIAAPQIGVSRRVVLVKLGTRGGQEARVETMLNPALEWASEETEADYEACLSIPGVGGLVTRPRDVRISYEALGGPRRFINLSGWDARIAQHELDHLDGVLYLDKLSGPLLPIEEMRARRDEERKRRKPAPDGEAK